MESVRDSTREKIPAALPGKSRGTVFLTCIHWSTESSEFPAISGMLLSIDRNYPGAFEQNLNSY